MYVRSFSEIPSLSLSHCGVFIVNSHINLSRYKVDGISGRHHYHVFCRFLSGCFGFLLYKLGGVFVLV